MTENGEGGMRRTQSDTVDFRWQRPWAGEGRWPLEAGRKASEYSISELLGWTQLHPKFDLNEDVSDFWFWAVI